MYKSAQDHISSKIRERLKIRHISAINDFSKRHPGAKSFLDRENLDLGKIREHAARILTAGTLGGALLVGTGQAHAQPETSFYPKYLANTLVSTGTVSSDNPQIRLTQQLNIMLPVKKRPLPNLTLQEEKVIGKMISKATNVPVVPVLEGERLNHVYGFIGAEQHLMRYPGDSINNHGELTKEGMAPNRGGFGYFAPKEGLTEEAIMREKYYVAVQTLYIPDWKKRLKYLVNWYKWRKVLVVNPDNGKVVVAVVGDAGPAAWTGKHFGGSPEVMYELGGKRYKKGRVLLYFVDDVDNKIPLGPVNYQLPEMLEMPIPFMQNSQIEKKGSEII